MRKKIGMGMSPMDIAIEMSEGNPSALDVIMRTLQSDPMKGFMSLLSLDDMNIRGPQIWLGYKDHCGQDLDKFLGAVKARDPEMVATINKEMSMDPKYTERAVTGGASFTR